MRRADQSFTDEVCRLRAAAPGVTPLEALAAGMAAHIAAGRPDLAVRLGHDTTAVPLSLVRPMLAGFGLGPDALNKYLAGEPLVV